MRKSRRTLTLSTPSWNICLHNWSGVIVSTVIGSWTFSNIFNVHRLVQLFCSRVRLLRMYPSRWSLSVRCGTERMSWPLSLASRGCVMPSGPERAMMRSNWNGEPGTFSRSIPWPVIAYQIRCSSATRKSSCVMWGSSDSPVSREDGTGASNKSSQVVATLWSISTKETFRFFPTTYWDAFCWGPCTGERDLWSCNDDELRLSTLTSADAFSHFHMASHRARSTEVAGADESAMPAARGNDLPTGVEA